MVTRWGTNQWQKNSENIPHEQEFFSELCSNIKLSVGEKEFKSESYIDAFLANKDSMYMAHEKTTPMPKN